MRDETTISRRALLQGAAAVGVSALVAGPVIAPGPAEAADVESIPDFAGEQYGFLVRTDRCTNCQECVKACRRANQTPEGAPARRTVKLYELDNGKKAYLSTSCMHCADPACANVCPAHAIVKGEGGVVVVDHDRCIGCKYCYEACPFAVPHYTERGMDKCDCCLEAGVELGAMPNCVQACKFRALRYGTLEELLSGAQGRAQQVECSTGPSLLLQ